MNADLALASESPRIPSTRFSLVSGKSIIGRSSKCDFVVRDDSVSRRHAEIAVTHGTIIVRDLDSRNGTFIDSQRIVTERLREGQRISFGMVSFLLTGGLEFQEPDSDMETAKFGGPTGPIGFGEADLTRAQRRVFTAILDGLSEKQIARKIDLSKPTVHNHIQAIYRILNVHSRSELFARFLKRIART
jgi:DNA-binding CsgD family transcriptional regulator